MELGSIFLNFLERAVDDPVIGPSHISLFAALLYMYDRQDGKLPISAFSRDLKKQAKISNRTYHACINDLRKGGYIKYIPSYNPFLGSLIYL